MAFWGADAQRKMGGGGVASNPSPHKFPKGDGFETSDGGVLFIFPTSHAEGAMVSILIAYAITVGPVQEQACFQKISPTWLYSRELGRQHQGGTLEHAFRKHAVVTGCAVEKIEESREPTHGPAFLDATSTLPARRYKTSFRDYAYELRMKQNANWQELEIICHGR